MTYTIRIHPFNNWKAATNRSRGQHKTFTYRLQINPGRNITDLVDNTLFIIQDIKLRMCVCFLIQINHLNNSNPIFYFDHNLSIRLITLYIHIFILFMFDLYLRLIKSSCMVFFINKWSRKTINILQNNFLINFGTIIWILNITKTTRKNVFVEIFLQFLFLNNNIINLFVLLNIWKQFYLSYLSV